MSKRTLCTITVVIMIMGFLALTSVANVKPDYDNVFKEAK